MSGPLPVLVVGDANADLVLRGDVVPRFGQAEQLLEAADVVLGGSAAIVAHGLARLGVPVRLAAVVGDDAFGEATTTALRAAGVDTSGVRVQPGGATGLSVVLAPAHTGGDRAILTLPGTVPALRPDDVEVRDATWVHSASPFLMPAFTEHLAAVLASARAAGARTSLDTNWDPAERWTAVGEALRHVDVLMPNRSELAALRASGALAHAGRLRVVLKDGAAGGRSSGPDGPDVAAPGLAVDVVDTTGAGDSFDAGYLAAVSHGVRDEAERVRWAAVAGSLSTRAAGGTAAQPDLAELRSHL
ncbi:carbohydrate kinase family protein [Quadrisphaera sp. KR29]|uniref:carbohydrate kinase family protein n=1 Tax=Quadrisphaera sp. KR29 TaxID=3461391 RepID=UPI00404433BA